jgi:hypothetical protein
MKHDVLPVLKEAAGHEGVWMSGNVAPGILDFGTTCVCVLSASSLTGLPLGNFGEFL